MNALQFEAVKVALKQDRTGFVLTLSIHPDEAPEELLRDFVGARYGVAMVRIQDNETATPYDNRLKKAGMLGRSTKFHLWLRKENSLTIDGEDDAVDAIHRICGIKSRTELNGNRNAQKLFDEMVEDYEQWSDKDEPF
jgi:Xaa-Pro aminopeptidase